MPLLADDGVLEVAAQLTSSVSLAYWIAFGPHGPRTLPPPGENRKIFAYTMIGVGVSFIIFYLIHSASRGAPATMTKEYQEKTNKYLKVHFPSTFFPKHKPDSFPDPSRFVSNACWLTVITPLTA